MTLPVARRRLMRWGNGKMRRTWRKAQEGTYSERACRVASWRFAVKYALALSLSVFASGMMAFSGSNTRAASEWMSSAASLTTPAADSSAQPQLSASGDGVILSWIERDGDRATLKFADRTASGWSAPQTVASGTDWFVNWADVPSVVRLRGDSLAAHWLQKSAAGTYAYDVRLAFSSDGGRTWSAPTSPHHDGTHTEHGFASLFQASDDAGLGLVWLDGRAMKEMKPGDHEGTNIGAMSVRAGVFDGTGRQVSETLVDGRVCECCPTAAAVTSKGPIVAFRNRTEDEIRDIYVSRLESGRWTEPVAVHRDNWRIAACPVNGPALSANGDNVVIAWFTATGNEGHVFAAFSSDAGTTFAPPIRIDDVGALGRVDVELLADGAAAVSWIEFAEQRSQFRIRRVDRSGSRSDSIGVAGISSARASGYPRIARRGHELIFAWTDTQNGSRVRTATARLTTTGTRE